MFVPRHLHTFPYNPYLYLYLVYKDSSSLSNIFILTTYSYAYVAFFNYYPIQYIVFQLVPTSVTAYFANYYRILLLEIRVSDWVWLDIRNISMQRPIKLLNYKNLGPYLIKRVINRGAVYKLELLPTLATRRIQPIFYLQLLYLYQPNPLLGQIQPKPLLVLIRDKNKDENYKEWTVK